MRLGVNWRGSSLNHFSVSVQFLLIFLRPWVFAYFFAKQKVRACPALGQSQLKLWKSKITANHLQWAGLTHTNPHSALINPIIIKR